MTGGPGSLIRRVVGGPAAAGTRPGVSEQSLRPGHPTALARVFGAGATQARTILVPSASGVGGWVHAVVRRSIGVAARSYADGGVPARWRSAAIVPARSTLFAGPGVAVARSLATLLTGHPAVGSAAGRPDATALGAGSAAGRALNTAAGRPGVGSTADGVLGTGTRAPARSAVGATDRPDRRRATGRSGPPSPGTPIRRRFSPTPGRTDQAPRIVTSGVNSAPGSAGSSGRTSLVLAGLPAAVTGTAARRRPLTDIAVAPSAATTPVGSLASAFSAIARWGDSLIRRRRTSDVRAGFDGPAADRSWTSRSLVRSSTRTPTSAVTASAAPAAHRSRARPLRSVVYAGAPERGVPTSVRPLIPSDRRVFRLPSIGSARTISPARNPAGGDRSVSSTNHLDRTVSTARRAESVDEPAQLLRSRGMSVSPTALADRARTEHRPAGERLVTPARSRIAGDPPVAAAGSAGLLLRQAIPSTAVIAAASTSMIRRMPPSPPRGTPRLASHRQPAPGDRREPDVPRSADPSWSFAAAGTAGTAADRIRTGPTIGARTRGSRSVTLSPAGFGGSTGWAADPSATAEPRLDPASGRRPSLVDLVPPSLFDRARAGLAAAGPGAAVDVDRFAVRPPGTAVANPEGAQVDTNDIPPERQRIADALTPREWDELVDVIVDRLEDRIRDELARRGRRFTPGVL